MNCSRILIVDDEPDIEELVRQKFRREIKSGQRAFVFARDGKEALQQLDMDTDIEIVFSDINMPRMDGLTLLHELQLRDTVPTTVIVSAYSDQKNIRKAMNNGAFDFIFKPIEFDDFDVTIDKAVRHNDNLKKLQNERMVAERNESQLRRYFSPSIARAVSEDSSMLMTMGERRTATFLFTDLADFTPLVENTPPHTVVELLNRYFDEMVRIVFEFDGTLMKIIGDALQVTFGAPESDPDHARNAVACAMELDLFAESYSREMVAKGIMLGSTRIGINTGEAIVGSFGGERFFDYTAYGTAVNLAARLEEANKILGTRICVSQNTADLIDGFVGRPVGKLSLKGISQALMTFEPMTEAEAGSPSAALYNDAYASLENSDPNARQIFAKLIGTNTEDPLAAFHFSRVLAGANNVLITI